jgi:hypothetical protein
MKPRREIAWPMMASFVGSSPLPEDTSAGAGVNASSQLPSRAVEHVDAAVLPAAPMK